jgi:putative transposase
VSLAFRIHQLPESPYPISQIVRALGVSRASYYRESILAIKDKQVVLEIERIHEEEDDTLGHKKLAELMAMGKNRVLRVMKKYGIKPRKRRNKYYYAGKSATVFENVATHPKIEVLPQDIIFSDIFEFKLADSTRVRGCFALKKQTRQILSLLFDYSMKADLVISTINRIDFVDPDCIWHSDQGKQYGAGITVKAVLERGFSISMSRAGTPTDNPYAERFVGIFKHAVVRRRKYHRLGDFLEAAKHWINFYNQRRPHESLGQLSPNQFALKHNLKTVPNLTNLSVYDFGY